MAKRKTTKVLALVANGDTGFDARNKINAGLTLTGDLESRIDGKADITYVDSEVSEKVSKSGDRMTGGLTIDMPNNGIPLVLGVPNPTDKQEIQGWSGNTLKWAVGVPNNDDSSTCLTNHISGVSVALVSNAIVATHPVIVNAAQPIDANSLTRKDYVDGNFVVKAGDTMTGALRITNPAEDLCKIDVSTYAATPRVDFYDATGAYTGRFAYEDNVLIMFNPKTSGKLSITPKGVESNVAFHSELNHSRGYMSIHPFGESYDGGGQAWIYYKDHDSGTPGVGMRGLVIETSDGATGTGGLMDITLNGSLVFHQNRPPTALEVGAVSREEFDTVVAELRAEIALLKGGSNVKTRKR